MIFRRATWFASMGEPTPASYFRLSGLACCSDYYRALLVLSSGNKIQFLLSPFFIRLEIYNRVLELSFLFGSYFFFVKNFSKDAIAPRKSSGSTSNSLPSLPSVAFALLLGLKLVPVSSVWLDTSCCSRSRFLGARSDLVLWRRLGSRFLAWSSYMENILMSSSNLILSKH